MTDPQPIGPAPTPTNVTWDLAVFDTPRGPAPWVRLVFTTNTGFGVYHFPPVNARALADGIAKLADEAETEHPSSGIIVPTVDTDAVLRSIKNGKKKR